VIAAEIGYPVVVRPSFVLGGRAMAIVYDEQSLDEYMRSAVDASPEKPILIDKFLERAGEIDVDALADETTSSSPVFRNTSKKRAFTPAIRRAFFRRRRSRRTSRNDPALHRAAREGLKVKGLMNIQYAIKDDRVYVLEVNPRASRRCRSSQRRPEFRSRRSRRSSWPAKETR
jgi:carbamoyl-phosphate synthase large subunit